MNNMIKNKATGSKTQREVKPIDKTTSRHVTFSKRRVGVFKKASELCVLTGAEVAVLCESIGGRVYAFGHPSVEHVVDKYLDNKNSSEDYSIATKAHVDSLCMHGELNKQYLEITEEMEIEKNKSVMIEGISDEFNKNKVEGDFWWQQPFDHLGEEELEEYISSMEKLMNNFKLRANDLRLIRTSSSMFDASNTSNSNDNGSLDEYVANKNLTTNAYGLPDEVLATKNLTKQDYGVPDEISADEDLKKKGYGLPDEFFTNKNMIKQDYGVAGEFFANKDLTKKGYDLPDEFFTNKKLSLNDDGLLTELLTINVSNFNDELDAFFTDLELPVDCNEQVPNNYVNTGNQV